MRHVRSGLGFVIAVVAMLFPASAYPQAVASNCSSPACIVVVGQSNGVPATDFGRFTIIARDAANQPVPGATIRISFMDCHDVGFSPFQHLPEGYVRPIYKTYQQVADAQGRADMVLMGGSASFLAPTSFGPCAFISVDGVQLPAARVMTFDLDGTGGLGANDLAILLNDMGTTNALGQGPARSDFDCSGTVGANDLSLWLAAFGSATMSESATNIIY